MFSFALRNAFCVYVKSWRRFVLPVFCIGFILWLCFVAMAEIVAHHRGSSIEARGVTLLILFSVMFLLEASSINFLRKVFQNEDDGRRNVFEVFSWRKLVRLLGVLIWLGAFGLMLGVFLQLPFLGSVAKWLMLFLIPLQFYVIITVLEKPDYRSWKCFFQGCYKTISQRWEMWAVWLSGWLCYRIIGRVAWVLTWWIPNKFAGFQVPGYWIMLSFVLLAGCVFPFGVFLLLSLRKIKLENEVRAN